MAGQAASADWLAEVFYPAGGLRAKRGGLPGVVGGVVGGCGWVWVGESSSALPS